MRGIASAELVIAVLTRQNPNVFYELGLAHRQSKDVLLLTEKIDDVPFDLRGLFCHEYDANSREGLKRLEVLVRRAARAVRAKHVLPLLKDTTTRTRQIIGCLDDCRKDPDKLRRTVLRQQARFSSFSHGLLGATGDPARDEYVRLLQDEQRAMYDCLREGATVQLLLSPSRMPWEESNSHVSRLRNLLDFLGHKDEWMTRCEVAIAPMMGPNLLFIGEGILFEGHKTTFESGYAFTTVYTDREVIRRRLIVFDSLFASARPHTLRQGDRPDAREEDPDALQQAVIRAIGRMLDEGPRGLKPAAQGDSGR